MILETVYVYIYISTIILIDHFHELCHKRNLPPMHISLPPREPGDEATGARGWLEALALAKLLNVNGHGRLNSDVGNPS